jgi:hypothetical protein
VGGGKVHLSSFPYLQAKVGPPLPLFNAIAAFSIFMHVDMSHGLPVAFCSLQIPARLARVFRAPDGMRSHHVWRHVRMVCLQSAGSARRI